MPDRTRPSSPAADQTGTALGQTRTQPPEAAQPPTIDTPLAIPGYRILGEIHRGGQGIVYRALQLSTHRETAVKVLLSGGHASPTDVTRFEREIELVAQLNHPNIVAVFDSGTTAGNCRYYVMPLIGGRRLGEHVRSAGLDIGRTLALFATICEAVDYAHQRGIVHRDLKPSNILVDESGQPQVLDFGLAKQSTEPDLTALSMSGQVLGTLTYMAPEQASARHDLVGPHTDVYALGVMLYEVLTGSLPYPVAGPLMKVLHNITDELPTPPARQWRSGSSFVTMSPTRPGNRVNCPIDNDLETITLKALAKDPARRYVDAGELARDLRRYLVREPIDAKRDSTWYVLRKRAVGVVRRHPPLFHVAAVVISIGVAYWLASPLFDEWSPVTRSYEHWLLALSPPTSADVTLDDVRVITLTDDTDLPAIAAAEGLNDLRPEQPKNIRSVYGRLLERLAKARPKTVVMALTFRGPSAYDESFVRGVRALSDAGVRVHVGLRSWDLNADGLPEISPNIVGEVEWGCTTGNYSAHAAWEIDLLHRRGAMAPASSLVLSAVTAIRQPDARASFDLDLTNRVLSIAYWKPNPQVERGRVPVGETDYIALTSAGDVAEENLAYGYREGDVLARFAITMPSDQVLDQASVTVEDVFAASAAQRLEWFGGRVVVIGNKKSTATRFRHPDGRNISAVYVSAVGIDALSHDIFSRPPQQYLSLLGLTVGGSLLGYLFGIGAPRAVVRRRLLLLLGLVVLVGGSWLSAAYLELIWSPAVPAVGLLLAAELSAGVQRVSHDRW